MLPEQNLVLEKEIVQRQNRKTQTRIEDEGNQNEIPAKMCLILDSREAQYPLPADLLRISIIYLYFFNKAESC